MEDFQKLIRACAGWFGLPCVGVRLQIKVEFKWLFYAAEDGVQSCRDYKGNRVEPPDAHALHWIRHTQSIFSWYFNGNIYASTYLNYNNNKVAKKEQKLMHLKFIFSFGYDGFGMYSTQKPKYVCIAKRSCFCLLFLLRDHVTFMHFCFYYRWRWKEGA